jgi:hypothetical protein
MGRGGEEEERRRRGELEKRCRRESLLFSPAPFLLFFRSQLRFD